MTTTGGPAHDIVIALDDGALLLDLAGPLEVFTRARDLGAGYRVRIATPTGAPARSTLGLPIAADLALHDWHEQIGTLVVIGSSDPVPVHPERLVHAVRQASTHSTRVVSVCVGAFVLAEAGLLHGRRATTHWARCGELARRYPALRTQPDAIFVEDGRFWTSAGVSAGIDLALALVERDCGSDLAREVARWLVVFLQRPGGQSQFSVRDQTRPTRNPALRALLDSITVAPAADHTTAALATRAALSPRHLTRLFASELGTTPSGYVDQIRVEAARIALESGDDPIAMVAKSCGFTSPDTFRRTFARLAGTSPAAYRKRFRAAAPPVARARQRQA